MVSAPFKVSDGSDFIFSFLDDVAFKFFICSFQVSLWSNVNPRRRRLFLLGRVFPCIFISGTWVFFCRLNKMDWNFEGEKMNPVSVDYRLILSIDFCMSEQVVLMFEPERYRLQSSAYSMIFTGDFMYLLISLIAIKKSVTLNGDPCGNPFSVSKVDDRVWLNLTSKVLSDRKLFINLSIFPLKSHFWSVERTL